MRTQHVLGGLLSVMIGISVRGDEPPLADPRPQVEARGPLHEAFAQVTTKDPEAPQAVPKQPPAPVPEEPPDQKPAGANVQWIPGYWQWDDERKDFIWISGFWRDVPEGRRWVPGYWVETAEGWRWVNGHWAASQEADRQYVPEPPPNIDEGPSTPPPDDNSFYVPGSWFYTESGYRWRPGYWADIRPDYVWVPATYVWSPRGYYFCSGYWDYAPFRRGLLFAPVYWGPRPFFAAGFVYRPSFVLATDVVFGSMFLRPGCRFYYFGDFYGPNYWALGYRPWFAPGLSFNMGFGSGLWGIGLGTGLAWGLGWGAGIGWGGGISWGGVGWRAGLAWRGGIGWGGGWFYDPLFVNQCWVHRNDRVWIQSQRQTFLARSTGKEPPPPRTVDLQTVSAKVPVIARPLSEASRSGVRLEMLPRPERQAILENARHLTAKSVEASRSERPTLPVPPPRTIPTSSSVRLNGTERTINRPERPTLPNNQELLDRLGSRPTNPSSPNSIRRIPPSVGGGPSVGENSGRPSPSSIPSVPNVSPPSRSIPTSPSLPSAPSLGNRSAAPDIGSRIGAPPVQAPPAISRPTLPSVPSGAPAQIPGTISRPTVPTAPRTISRPSLPSVPSVPNVGSMSRPSAGNFGGGFSRPAAPSLPTPPNLGGGSRGGPRR